MIIMRPFIQNWRSNVVLMVLYVIIPLLFLQSFNSTTLPFSLLFFPNILLNLNLIQVYVLYSSHTSTTTVLDNVAILFKATINIQSTGHTKDFKMELTTPQPVLVIMSLSKRNASAIKRRSSYLIQWTSRQRWYNSKSWLSFKPLTYLRISSYL